MRGILRNSLLLLSFLGSVRSQNLFGGGLLGGIFGNSNQNFGQNLGGQQPLLGGLLNLQPNGQEGIFQKKKAPILAADLPQNGRKQPNMPAAQGDLLGSLLGGLNINKNEQNGDIVGGVMDLINGIASIPIQIIEDSTKVDVLSDMKSLKKEPTKKEWRKKIRKFCHRYPGHPDCRRGREPQFNELDNMLKTIAEGVTRFLPKVPRMKIRDPLKDVDRNLIDVLKGVQLNLGQLPENAANNIKNVCRGGKFKCKEQPKHAKARKQLLQAKMLELKKKQKGSAATEDTDEIQLRFDRTLQLKEGLLEKANLSSQVSAVDDGIFDSDLLLTQKQVEFYLNELGKAGEGSDEIPLPEDFESGKTEVKEKAERIRRASLFFEDNIVQKWDPYSAVPYMLDDSLEELDKTDVRNALQEIQKNSCLRFEFKQNVTSQYHLVYYKVDSPTFCGLSYVGRTEPVNPIYLSFQCDNNRGVAIHETLHALGVSHQHLRPDRDQHLTIDWSNINPQMYDSFVVVDSKLYTTYGVQYDYGSIMHYNAYTGAVDVTKATMKPKVNFNENVQLLGQRKGMSKTDIQLLNKMYCQPGCDDLNVYCGAWALKGLCTATANKGWMDKNCMKSCNNCPIFN